MARSSSNDPINRFRFQVTIFSNDVGILGSTFTTGTRSSTIGISKDSGLFSRSGFSEVSSPKVTINNMSYRENYHGNDKIQVPGLASYDPVILKRGIAKDNDFYNWYVEVNNSSSSLNKYMKGLVEFSAIPFQKPNYRREVLISALNRDGSFSKHWLLYNAWPNSFKGSSDFNSTSEEISMSEISLIYETFLECKGASVSEALRDAQRQAEQASNFAAVAAAINKITKAF